MNFFYLIVGVCLVLIFQIYDVNGVQCGASNPVVYRIVGGAEAVQGSWPFVAALYNVKPSRFFCGGTLISDRHILTAAHCIQGKGSQSKMVPEDIEVLLGAYNLTNRNDNSILTKKVLEVLIHPDWDVYSDKYDNDLAILVLKEKVSFTNHIRHVCLPDDDATIVGARGHIVGWGLTENSTVPHTDIQREAVTEVLDLLYCLITYPHLSHIASIRMFCGTRGDGTPNRGDSGGGFFVPSSAGWVQYGIISSLNLGQNRQINMNTTAVYTSVKDFKDWILGIVTAHSTGVITTTHGGKVFFVGEGKYNFFDAIQQCRKYNSRSRLASIESEEESRAVEVVIKSHEVSIVYQYWVAGHSYRGTANPWRWIFNGKPFNYTDWSEGEPSECKIPTASWCYNEDCLQLMRQKEPNFNKFRWNNVHCERLDYYICEVY